MRIDEIEQDLKVIRQAMEVSSRYTNIPARGYLSSGICGILGTIGTYLFLGHAKATDLSRIASGDLPGLLVIWASVFFVAVGSVMFFSWRKARKNGIHAWNSLASRMFLSQVPLILATGVFTLAMALKGYYPLIPGLWLTMYGVILYSFSYFTGIGHKIEAGAFILFGIAALFGNGLLGLILLGFGFGGIHIASGALRKCMRIITRYESKSAK